MGVLMSIVPAPYRWLALAVLAAALLSFGWVKGAAHVQGQWDAEKQTVLVKTVTVQAKQAEASVQVITKYVDRVKVIHEKAQIITKEIPVYVTPKADAGCTVPVGFAILHDAAASGSPLPGPSGGPHDSPSGIALSAVASTVTDNYALCRSTAEQLTGLQNWVKSMREAAK
jgi:hypothetical protein